MPTKYVRYRQLKSEYDIPFSRVHLKRLIDAQQFPPPVHLGANTIAWLEEDILAWKDRIRAERDAKIEAARKRGGESIARTQDKTADRPTSRGRRDGKARAATRRNTASLRRNSPTLPALGDNEAEVVDAPAP
jgi:predicted DNA-binding transcriptional regulator AlpA